MNPHEEDPASDAAALRQAMASLRDRARFFRTERRKDVALYEVLADCMSLCERAEREGLVDAIRQEHLAALTGRRYFERSADVYIIVGRYVFEGEGRRRDAAWRYTAVMREAVKRQIASADLVEWLRTNGGINELFRRRDMRPRTRSTRTLHLNSPVEYETGKPITLTLVPDGRGCFDVIR